MLQTLITRHKIQKPFPGQVYTLIDIGSFSIIRNTPIWIEISEHDLGIPAAAMPILDKSMKVWRFPKELWDKLEPKTYHFRTVDSIGNEIAHFTYAHYEAI